MIKNPFICVLLIFVCGCATYNTATNRNEMILISTSSEVKMGQSIDAELRAKNKIITGTDESKRLENIGQRLARVSDRQDYQYYFYLVDSDEINAFTVPGGYIYFYTGLFRQLKSDDAIAAVLAHEIGHCAAKHTVKKFQAAMGYNVARNILLNIISIRAPGIESIAALGSDGIVSLAMSAYGRGDEYESDRLGIKYLYLAGFDINAMIDVFDVLQKEDKGQGVPAFLRTHPYVKDRVTAAKKEIAEVKTKY